MALTRRFFTALAKDFREARPQGDGTALAIWMHMVTITANALAAQNAMFNYGKFYEACGMPENFIEQATG